MFVCCNTPPHHARRPLNPPEPPDRTTARGQAASRPPDLPLPRPATAGSVPWTGDKLITIADVRTLFKLGRTAACELARRPDFPEPVPSSPRCYWCRPSEAPKNRKRRQIIYPGRAPAGYPLSGRLAARIGQACARPPAYISVLSASQEPKDRTPGRILPLYDAREVGEDCHAERDADLEAEP